MRVLIVVDGDGGYSAHNNRFGLTELIDAIESDAGDGLKFSVTKAHRYDAVTFANRYPMFEQGADIEKFVFTKDTFNIAAYDELWLFGFASSNGFGPYKDPINFDLQHDELQVIEEFMESGGGVFATGDHDDLGKDLCSTLPRVRSMRRWNFDYVKAGTDYTGYDEGSGDSPPVQGPYRHSTIVKNAEGHYEFDNQSDDIPQTVRPFLTTIASGTPYGRVYETLPHPLLCGLDGVINVLPDHMHEGQCQVPDDLTATFDLNGEQRDEYPSYRGGPLSPQVVAWEDIIARDVQPQFTDPYGARFPGSNDNEALEADTSGAIAAWDGHVVHRGRVVVDATFHHFVNVNIVGVGDDLHEKNWSADESVKYLGLKSSTSPEAQAAYRHIRQYWRNIARWLAPSTLQFSFGIHWIRNAAIDGRIRQEIGRAVDAAGQTRVGAAMRDIMGVFLPPCAQLAVSSVGIPDPLAILLGHWYIIKTLPDPPPELPVTLAAMSQLCLGVSATVVRRLTAAAPNADDHELASAIRETSERALREFFIQQEAAYEQAARNTGIWVKQLSRG
ncbi:hypothetical protein [Paraburkholderia sp. BR10882]|uniref:hypothetical protein n=1 Tax=unclassified Paraburkholderia TaxID=2615204 RepID=UPI0034CF7AA8